MCDWRCELTEQVQESAHPVSGFEGVPSSAVLGVQACLVLFCWRCCLLAYLYGDSGPLRADPRIALLDATCTPL